MIYATIEFTRASRRMTAHLTGEGWSVPEEPFLGDALTLLFGLGNYGPADGDPIYRSTHEAAELLDGRITFVAELEPDPPGVIY